MAPEFVHLHAHSQYSILDGASTVESMVRRAAELGQPAIALTDHGSLSGAYELWKYGRQYGVKPIIGMEAYLSPADHRLKEPVYWGAPEQRSADVSRGAYTHITLLAASAEGLRNLYKLHNRSFTEGFYHKPRISVEMLSKFSKGLIVLTGCPGGGLSTLLRLDSHTLLDSLAAPARPRAPAPAPLSWASSLRDALDPGCLYVELMAHGIDFESTLIPQLLSVAKELSLPVVATNDSHYTLPSDLDQQKAMLWLQTHGKFDGFNGSGYHIATYGEMYDTWGVEVPSSLASTLLIADQVGSYDTVFEPRNLMPKSLDGHTLREVLAPISAQQNVAYRTRLEYETDIIEQKGYGDYFLVLADVVRFCREGVGSFRGPRGGGVDSRLAQEGVASGRGWDPIMVGPGRGSAGGSLVAYLLGITGVDPVRHGLLFERFLNPDRISPPDIDIDFPPDRLEEVIRYVVNTYGSDRVAQIRTFGTQQARGALKDAARVLGREYAEGDALAKMVPPNLFGRSPSLSDTPVARAADPEVFALAEKLEGGIKSLGKHAAGIVISPEPLAGLIPVEKRPDDGMLVTGFPNETLEELGFMKLDLLSLQNLTIIQQTLEMIDDELVPSDVSRAAGL